jgi:hypothetical protein
LDQRSGKGGFQAFTETAHHVIHPH